MSSRVDALANDLIGQAQSTSGGQREAALTALAGLLDGSGARLTPATRTAAGAALRSLLGSTGKSFCGLPIFAHFHCMPAMAWALVVRLQKHGWNFPSLVAMDATNGEVAVVWRSLA